MLMHNTREGFGSSLAGLAAMLCILILSPAVHGARLSGQVTAVNDGLGVDAAMVTLTPPTDVAGAGAITVFTGPDGSFSMPLDSPQQLGDGALRVEKLGYRQVQPAPDTLQLRTGTGEGQYRANVYVEAVADIGGQVPASAWLAGAPAGDARNIMISGCSSCHQMPSPRVREYAAKIEAASVGKEGSEEALRQWRKVVRHESWRIAVTYMRAKHYAVFPLESAMNLDAIDWPTAKNADYFEGKIEDGILFARGACDEKGSTPGMIYGYDPARA